MSAAHEPNVHRWTRVEYDAMVESGLFDQSNVELLDGAVIDLAPASNRHAWVNALLVRILTLRLDPERYLVCGQSPLALDDISEPEPDVMVLQARPGLYLDDHPSPADVVLVIEVSYSSWRYDAGEKLAVYARGQVPEVWLVDLNTDVVHICRLPVGGNYSDRSVVQLDGSVTVPGTGVAVEVAAFLRP